MSDWTEIDYLKLLVGKAIRSTDALALWENQFAIAEQAADAPILASAWHPYDRSRVGGAEDGTFWDFAVDGVSDDIATPTFEDGWEYGVLFEACTSTGSSGVSLDVSYYVAASSSWSSYTASGATGGGSTGMYAFHEIPRPRWMGAGPTLTVGIGSSTPSKVDAARYSWASSGQFSGGKMRLLRRATFV